MKEEEEEELNLVGLEVGLEGIDSSGRWPLMMMPRASPLHFLVDARRVREKTRALMNQTRCCCLEGIIDIIERMPLSNQASHLLPLPLETDLIGIDIDRDLMDLANQRVFRHCLTLQGTSSSSPESDIERENAK